MSDGGIIGEGLGLTELSSIDETSADLIAFNSQSPCLFKDFLLVACVHGSTPAKTGGSGLSITAPSSFNSTSFFENVNIQNCPIGFNFANAVGYSVVGCGALNWTTAGIAVSNPTAPDSGDSTIMACGLESPATTGGGIIQNGSGGLKIIGSKFNGGQYNFLLNNVEGTTSDLVLTGNSMEGATSAAIFLARPDGSANFSNVVIGSNQIALTPTGIITDSSGFLSLLTITGNIINLDATAPVTGINIQGVTDFNISSNVIVGTGGASDTGISIGSACSHGKIGHNTYNRVAVAIANDAASSASISIAKDTQTGTGTTPTTGWSPYGALFQSSSVSITFPSPFLTAPAQGDVQVVLENTNGEVAAILGVPTTTGFTVEVISVISGVAANFAWKAAGIM
jgi:hypothetical protein